ncbi:hypothetical protein SAMN04488123_11639 [Natribacillus halophilus]|uniref:Uncharacterized protein n=1 Tax=Natribacillus halophilus TaxID=549003 RepID=A0A1G8RBC4_9BACI|nr:hypothetical protein SAMN04488123_11639 [Natribacillus halophilus]
MPKVSVAQAIIKILLNEDVEKAFSVPGEDQVRQIFQ